VPERLARPCGLVPTDAGAPAIRPLEDVEKVFTNSMVALLDGTEREHATRVPLVASLVELATGSGSAWSWSSSLLPRPSPAKYLGFDLDGWLVSA
jgi:hypothetical protein